MGSAVLLDEEQDERKDGDGTEEQTSVVDQLLSEQEGDDDSRDDDGLPDKYRGKSLEDVVKMHQEAEKLLGRQSSEVGELRKAVDQLIQTQLDSQKKADTTNADADDEEVDYYSDPEKAVNRAIENHPKIREAAEATQNFRRTTALNELQTKHPDMKGILNDPKFAEWVQASKIRTQLFVRADREYDYEAADELFSLWKDRTAAAQQTAEAERQSRKNEVRKAGTGSASANPDGMRGGKIYRRADIIKLMKEDPDRYMALSDEIQKAYAEGRVK